MNVYFIIYVIFLGINLGAKVVLDGKTMTVTHNAIVSLIFAIIDFLIVFNAIRIGF